MHDADAWARDFFRGTFVDLWLAATSDDETRQEADFLENTLEAKPGAKLLDLACGGGRHSVELASRGYAMTGVDLSSEFLSHARRKSDAVRWEERPMHDLPWPGEYDGAFIMGNSLGGVDDDGHARFFSSVHRALKPGARFIIDTGVLAESILPHFHERRWWELGDLRFLVHNRYDPMAGRLTMDFTILKGGEVESKSGFSQVYTLREFCGLLGASGSFDDPQAFAGTAGEPYVLGSQRCLLSVRKMTA